MFTGVAWELEISDCFHLKKSRKKNSKVNWINKAPRQGKCHHINSLSPKGDTKTKDGEWYFETSGSEGSEEEQ